jgi:putative tryptophan/tyrosine transport system substrate-binding protein
MRRIGVLMYATPDEPESQARITALAQGLQETGWAVGRNLRIDVRWGSGDLTRLRKDAADLVALRPDVIVAGVGPTTSALQQETRAADRDGPGRRPGRGRLCQEHRASRR